jgi:hypothetical protein
MRGLARRDYLTEPLSRLVVLISLVVAGVRLRARARHRTPEYRFVSGRRRQ